MTFELRVYRADDTATSLAVTAHKTLYASPMAALVALAHDTAVDKSFEYQWAECWLIQPTGDARQWKLIVD